MLVSLLALVGHGYSHTRMHPDFNETSLENNIALIELTRKARKNIDIIPMATARTFRKVVNQPGICHVSGWGFTELGDSINDLSALEVTVIRDRRCQVSQIFFPSNICYQTKKGGLCKGDEGAPLTCIVDGEPVLMGIHSVGVCEFTPAFQFAMDMASFLPWVTDITQAPKPSGCGSVPLVNNGEFDVDESNGGDSATLECDSGISPNFGKCSATISCVDGGWVIPEDLCTCACSVIGRAFNFHIPSPIPTKNAVGGVEITSPYKVNANVTLTYKRGDELFVIDLFGGVIIINLRSIITVSGIEIKANVPVTVFASASMTNRNRPSSGGTMIHPSSCASNVFTGVVGAYTGYKKAMGQITVVSLHANTTIGIMTLSPPKLKNTYTLMGSDISPFDPLIYRTDEITPFEVIADGPVAVFLSHDCANYPTAKERLDCDFVFEELKPKKSLSKAYILTQMSPRPDIYVRITAIEDNTKVTINMDSEISFDFGLQESQSFVGSFLDVNMLAISSNNLIFTEQVGSNFDEDSSNIGDPSLLIPIGLDRFETSYQFSFEKIESGKPRVALVILESYDQRGILINEEPIKYNRFNNIMVPGFGRFVNINVPVRASTVYIRHENGVPFGAVFYQSAARQEIAMSLGGIW